MPFFLTNGNGVRTAALYFPWQLVQRIQDGTYESGVPLVVCLHGGADEATPAGRPVRNINDAAQAMKLHYIPQGRVNPGMPNSPPDPRDVYATLYVQGRGLKEVSKGASWNSGHMDMNSAIAGLDDVPFIDDTAEAAIQIMSDFYFRETGKNADVIDTKRMHLCGFGNGGCMVYRHVVESRFEWDSMVVVNGAFGGRFQLLNSAVPPWRPTPTSGTPKTRLLVFHGIDNEEFVPTDTSPPLTDFGVVLPSEKDADRVDLQGPAATVNPAHVVRQDLSLITGVRDWVVFNQGAYLLPGPTPFPSSSDPNHLYSWLAGTQVQMVVIRQTSDSDHRWPFYDGFPTPNQSNLATAGFIWQFMRDGSL